ncbi:MAG: T9SS type A sorting domain-containing protein [Ferruginibacter sp.]
MNKNLHTKILMPMLLLIAMAGGMTQAKAQFSIAAAATNYSQDFNTLTTGTWTDNTTLSGWYAKTDATASITTYGANTGSTTTAGLYAFGVAGTNPLTDRALGFAPSNAFTGASAVGKGYIGWRLKNNTGSTISSITVTWTGEQWRRDNAAGQSLVLSYQQAATVTNLTAGTWTAAGSTFTSPQLSATALALDGNAPANRTAAISVTITVTILAGEEIMLRWEDLNDSGNDHLMAIDDISITAVAAVAAGTSTITAGAAAEPATISSLTTTQGVASLNFDFMVTDDGATPATDAVATQISQLVLTAGTGNTVANWTNAIAGVELNDGTNSTTTATIGTSSITFAALPNAVGNLGYIADDAVKTYTLKVWLKNPLGALATTIDGQKFVFDIQNSGVTLAGGSSQLAASQDINSGSGNNVVDVTATALAFIQQPTSPTGLNVPMTPAVTVAAQDANGNRDLDFVASVRITSSGTLTGAPVDVAAVAGLATFTGLTHTAAGTGLTLTAVRTATLDFSVVSNPFDIIIPSNTTDYFRSKTTGNWGSPTTWESSADNASWHDATLAPDSTANTINILSGHNVTVAAAANGDQIIVNGSGILTLSATFTLANGAGDDLTVMANGTVVNTAGTHVFNGTGNFAALSLYQHARNGGAFPTAIWDANSTAEVTGGTTAAPTNISQALGNFTWNSVTTTTVNLVGTLTTVNGNFRVQNSGTAALRLTGTADLALTVGGNFIVEDDIDIDNSATGATLISIAGNFSQTGGVFQSSGDVATINMTGFAKTFNQAGGTFTNTNLNWAIVSGSSITLASNLPIATGRTLAIDGLFTTGVNSVTGAGSASVSPVGNLRIGSLNTTDAVSDNFQLTGGLTLASGSNVFFNGSSAQFMGARTFSNLSISNPAGVTLTGAVTATGSVVLSNGNLTLGANNLTTAFTTGGATGYVVTDGIGVLTIKSIGAATVFPVGATASSFTPATINNIAGTPDDFSVSVAVGTPCNAVPLASVNRVWTITELVLGGSNASIDLEWNATDENAAFNRNLCSAVHCSGGSVDQNGPVGAAAGSGPYRQTVTGITAFSPFGVTSDPTVLPVTVEYFRGAKQNGSHLLDWKVSCTNTPSATLIVERSSNGRSFSSIYNINATALRCQQPFSYSDASPVAGINYYRLKMVDADGKISYSSIIALLNSSKGFEIVGMLPNPVTAGGAAILNLTSAEKINVQVVVTDIAGRKLVSSNESLTAGSNQLALNLNKLAAGTYQVTVYQNDGAAKTIRFVKQ